jgi:hypothetical protein
MNDSLSLWEQIRPTIYTGITVLLGYGIWWLNEFISRKKTGEKIRSLHRTDMEATGVLWQYLERFHAQRIYVAKFRNGEHFDDKTEVRRYTWVYECATLGERYCGEDYKDMLTTWVPEEFDLILDNGPGFAVIKDLKPSRFKSQCESRGTQAVARVLIYVNKQMIGYIGVDFRGTDQPANINELESAAGQLAEIMARSRAG